jgi:hypothetical protein
MMRKAVYPLVLFLVLGIMILSSCDEFYSSSWGTAREYDPAKIDLNVNNLDAWTEAAIGNPELAAALLQRVKSEIPKQTDPKNKAKYQEAGVGLAVEASGIGTSILSNATSALDQLDSGNQDVVKDILANIQGDFKKNKGDRAAGDLTEILDVQTGNNIPQLNPEYSSLVTPADAGQAVLVLALATVDDIDENTNLNDFETNLEGLKFVNGQVTVDGSEGPEARALAAYCNLIANDDNGNFDSNPMTRAIKNAFGLGKQDE